MPTCRFNHIVLPANFNQISAPVNGNQTETRLCKYKGKCNKGDACKFKHPDPVKEKKEKVSRDSSGSTKSSDEEKPKKGMCHKDLACRYTKCIFRHSTASGLSPIDEEMIKMQRQMEAMKIQPPPMIQPPQQHMFAVPQPSMYVNPQPFPGYQFIYVGG